MFGTGERVGRGAGADWAGTIRAEVRVTGIGGVRAMRAEQRIEAEGAGSWSGVSSAGLKVKAWLPRANVLRVGAGEFNILSFWIASTALRLGMLILGKIILLVNCQTELTI